LPEHFAAAGDQDHPGTRPAKRQCGFFANPAGGAGHDDHLIVKVRIHGFAE